MEEPFVRGWRQLTEATRVRQGGLGSRLHRCAEENLWVTYAQWPSREDWEAARTEGAADPEAAALMCEALEARLAPIALEVEADLITS